MNLLILVFSIFAITSLAFSQDNPTIVNLTNSRTTLSWSPTSNEKIKVHADEGYEIQIDVINLNLDGENDHFVSIKDDQEANELMFTYVVSEKPSYLYTSNEVQAVYVGNNTVDQFMLQFTRVGEALITTTSIPTTTPEPMPTPAPEEKAHLTVYLVGLSHESYNDTEITSLKKTIAKMGTEYCNDQNCPLNGSITSNNVQIEMLKQCPVLWQNSICVNLTFALPIVKPDDQEYDSKWNGYQLNEYHLKILWDTYASKYLGDINLSLYRVPDIDNIFKYRILVICLIIVTLFLLIVVVRHFAIKSLKKRRKLSDTVSIVDHSSNRTSQLSLTPHYLQELPSYFTSDFPMFAEENNTI